MRKISVVIYFFGLILYRQYSFATSNDTSPLLTESEFFGDIPIVYTASRLPQPKSEAPAAVTVIDADMIKSLGIRRIEDVFRFVPGFQVGYFRGFFGAVTYHGGSSEFVKNMQVFVDGRSVYGPLFGGVAWQDLPLVIEDIERIEVIRGPDATTYGSNAVAAVINIITRHSSQNLGKHFASNIGSDNIRDMMYSQAWTDNNSSYRLSARYRQDDGFASLPDNEHTKILTFKTDQQLDNNDALTMQFGILAGTRGYGYNNDPVLVPRSTDGFSHFQQISWRHTFNDKEEFDLNFFHNYKKHVDDFSTNPLDLGPLGIARVPLSFSLVEQRYQLEAQHTIQFSPSVRVNWGASARLEQVSGWSWFGTDEIHSSSINSLYANGEWRADPRNIFNAGLMIEDSGQFGTNIMPRIAFNHHISQENTVRFSVSQAARKPLLFEDMGKQISIYENVPIDINVLASGGLTSEENTCYEMAFLHQNLSTGISWNVRLYRDSIRKIINEFRKPVVELDPGGTAFDYVNSGSANVDGIEIEYEYRPSASIRFVFNQAFMRANAYGYDTKDYNFTYTEQKYEESVPDYTTSLMLISQLEQNWWLTTSLYRVAQMRWLGDGSIVPAYTRVDLRLARNIKLQDTSGSISFTVQNIGKDYVDFTDQNFHDANIFKTRYFLSAELNF
jgi:iron complex outermembrane receptor protein